MRWERRGKIYEHTRPNGWWHSHAMAPSAVALSPDTIRVYLGCWDAGGISRIGYIDVASDNPATIRRVCERPVLDIGRDGCFDENGVFPAHASLVDGEVRLYYTGFQLGHKVRHYNFGGLAVSRDGERFTRVSEAPILDRADEGLTVRAGQSVWREGDNFRTVYAAGNGWETVGDRPRPVYDVYYQDSPDGRTYASRGRCIVAHDPAREHGLGRPQITKIGDEYFVFYTRRTLDLRYFMGCARSRDGRDWTRADELIDFRHPDGGFDSQMIYFPSVVQVPGRDRWFLFYSGNDFGGAGLGYAELVRS
jgi:predicted GH43/DUF377 family glycosyl hydrolase